MKKIILTVLSIIVIASSAFSYTNGQTGMYVRGPIVGVWVNPTNGNYSVSIQTNTIYATTWNATTSKWDPKQTISITPATVFTVEVPNSNGISKNALAGILSARAAGVNIKMGFSNYNATTNSAVVTSDYCEIFY